MSRDAWKRYAKGGSWRYDVVLPGFKYNMTDIQAALGLGQLGRMTGFQQRRRQIVARYHAAFGPMDAFELPVELPHVDHAWHLYVLRLRPEVLRIDRDQFVTEMAELNIATSVHFIPVHTHPYYRDKYGYLPNDFPVAYDAFTRMVSLPLNPRMSDTDVDDVIDAVQWLATDNRR
jgi:dTDP-4-amino-4,6-dideoxygalactose transaminase